MDGLLGKLLGTLILPDPAEKGFVAAVSLVRSKTRDSLWNAIIGGEHVPSSLGLW
ncbi:hypothetical protein [Thermomicrobium sp.]